MNRNVRRNVLTVILCAAAAVLVFLAGMSVQVVRDSREYTTEKKLEEAVQILRSSYVGELDEADMADYAISAMVSSTHDRWSYYMTAEGYQAYLDSQNNQYGGLGIVIGSDESGLACVKKVYAQSAAGEAGIPVGGRFVTVGEQDVSDWGVTPVSDLLKEMIPAGLVEMTLRTPEGELRDYRLVPGPVLTEPVTAATLDSGFGYIRVENFENRSADMAIAAVDTMAESQVPGIIFDMRGNPGGQLRELLKLLDHLLPEGKLFISQTAGGPEEIDWSDADCVRLPMAVLVNGDTYSAAEFFAAAMNEYGWAQVIGSPTTGKGRAQATFVLSDGSAIHISKFRYRTPEGRDLTDVGLTPDVPVELSSEKKAALYQELLPAAEDDQLQAAEAALRAAIAESHCSNDISTAY